MVSVIVPVYNSESFLRQCLNSLINQTYKNIQIICVNDGSCDSSLSILKEYSIRDSRLLIIDQDNKGQSAARNEALKHAQGQFITFVDSDDWLDLDCIEKARYSAISSGADIVMWGYIKESTKDSSKVELWNRDITWKENECSQLRIRLLGLVGDELSKIHYFDSLSPVCCKLYKTSLFQNFNITFTNLIEIGTGEDALVNQKIFKFVKTVTYCSEVFYHYRRNTNSTTRSYRENQEQQLLRLLELMKENYKDYDQQEIVSIAFNNRICVSLIGLTLNIHSSKLSISKKYKSIRKILHSNWYKEAISFMDYTHLKSHWKIYFFSAKHKLTLAILILSYIIKFARAC